MTGDRPPLAVTLGEPAGIGPELVAMAWQRRGSLPDATFYCAGDAEFLRRRCAEAGIPCPVVAVPGPNEAPSRFEDGLPVVSLPEIVRRGAPGRPDPADAAAVIASIAAAVEHVRTGAARAVVTPPIHKRSLYAAGFAFPGHTEFLGELARTFAPDGPAPRPVMMLACEEVRAVPVTIHIPLKDVPAALTKELIVETARIVARDLRERFGVATPRLALAGLNPHAGEEGTMGREEVEIIAPAIAELRAEGVDARGPLPGDTLFHAAARQTYDAVLAMYHDQGLIPVKTLAFDRAVNVTLGLPFVRTSPDHGTALDIAGTGRADPGSLIEALRLADRMSRTAT